MAKEEAISEKLAEAWEANKRLYIIVKHQHPDKLEDFSKCLDPLLPDILI